MADKNLLSQMLEHLVNDEQAKAEELFHEYVVGKSREIYEGLIESEIEEASDEDEDDEDLDEASKASEEDDEEMDENFEGIAVEGDDEEGGNPFGGDATDDLEGELGGEEGSEQSEEEIMQDLGDIIDELQAKFDALTGSEEEQGEFGDEGGMDDENEGFEPEMATVREYVEKVPGGHGAEKKGQAEKADNKTSIIDNMKNDMGGTTANILSGRNGADGGEAGAAGGALKGNGLLKGAAKEENFGNVNVPGGNAGKTGFKKKEPGHGAEKKGAAEGSTEAQSLFRGRR